MNRDPDRSGQAGALTVLTPVAPGAELDLRAYLDGLRAGPSPLARSPSRYARRSGSAPGATGVRTVSAPAWPERSGSRFTGTSARR